MTSSSALLSVVSYYLEGIAPRVLQAVVFVMLLPLWSMVYMYVRETSAGRIISMDQLITSAVFHWRHLELLTDIEGLFAMVASLVTVYILSQLASGVIAWL
jgi:hypothetical protein